MNNANPSNEWVEIDGAKYRVDGEFYIAEDESHVIYRDERYNQINGYYKCLRNLAKNKPANLHRAVWLNHFVLLFLVLGVVAIDWTICKTKECYQKIKSLFSDDSYKPSKKS